MRRDWIPVFAGMTMRGLFQNNGII